MDYAEGTFGFEDDIHILTPFWKLLQTANTSSFFIKERANVINSSRAQTFPIFAVGLDTLHNNLSIHGARKSILLFGHISDFKAVLTMFKLRLAN